MKAKALAATPGPWWIDSHGHTMISEDNLEVIFYNDNSARPAVRHDSTGNLSHWRNDCDASYIAAANPAVTLELIERLQQAETERDALKAQRDELLEAISKCLSESNACVGGMVELSAQLGKIRAISNAAIAKCEVI